MKMHAGDSAAPRVTFWGAARSVTGSMHLVEAGKCQILLDCGLVVGGSPEAYRRNQHFPFIPAELDAVVLSHAHMDHCGNLPNLVRQGFTGPIYCTPPTRDLLPIMLTDSARVQEDDAYVRKVIGRDDDQPLYTHADVLATLQQCVAIPYGSSRVILPDVQLRFADAGHLLGSAMVSLTLAGPGRECRITYTGDLGRRGMNFLPDPDPIPAADLLLCESTYGGCVHQPLEMLAEVLEEAVRRTVERGGKVLIPAFSLGRAQLVVHFLEQWVRQGRLPRVPIFVDSPLAADIARIHELHDDYLAEPGLRGPGEEPLVHYLRDHAESQEASTGKDPCILVASGGMCEAGRILQHLRHHIDDPRSTVVLVGYQSPQSLGRRLLERRPTVHFRGRKWNKWADVVDLKGFSGHADHGDFLSYLEPLAKHTRQVRLVHGEPERADALAHAMRGQGFAEVTVPCREETVQLA